MARQVAQPSPSSSIDTVNLTRLLNRLEHNVLSPSADTKSLSSSAHRARVSANLEYARTLLLRLEHFSSSIKIQSRKQSTQADLLKKRELIKRLNERLNEYAQVNDDEVSDTEDDSPGEDLLGEDEDHRDTNVRPIDIMTEPLDRRKSGQETKTTNTLRSRNLRTSQAQNATTTGTSLFNQSQSPSSNATTSTSETLTSHRREEESLHETLLTLVGQLKSSTIGFQTSLEDEKPTLERATEGLDRNTSGMEAAGKKMGVLKRMSEGRGWLGRMMLYAWILGLMVVAVLIVFVGPKLRF